jgi:GT2 family glycosyltransferase
MIAILIINYNSDLLTIKCIESIFESKNFTDFFVSILDNSDSTTGELISFINNIVDKDRILLFHSGNNLGFAGGIDYLYNKTKSNNITHYYILNNDCIIYKDTLENIFNESIRDINIIYSSKILRPNKSVWFEGGVYNDIIGTTRHVPYSLFVKSNKRFLSGCAILLPKSIIDKVGLFDKKFFLYGEDLDYSIRLINAGYGIDICHSSIVIHSVGGSSKYKSYSAYYNYVTNTVGAFISKSSLFKSLSILLFYLSKSLYLFLFEFKNIKNNIGHLFGLFNAYNIFCKYKEVINFFIFGAFVSLFQVLTNIFLVSKLGLDEIISYRITYFPIVCLSYYLHSRFTFRSGGNFNMKFPLFFLQSLISYFIGEFSYALFLKIFNYVISLFISILITAAFSFYFNKFIVFKKGKFS